MIKISEEKSNVIEEIFSSLLAAQNLAPAPWQAPRRVDGIPIFPAVNNAQTLDFFLLLGALNFSYWDEENGRVKTWGVISSAGEKVIDVFALAYCLSAAVETEKLKLEADFYTSISEKNIKKIFSSRRDRKCNIPMFEQRVKKIRELGAGLKRFAADQGTGSTAIDFLRKYESLPELLAGLTKYFPYSFGDPFQKLSQLFFKMIYDRRPENMPSGLEFETDSAYLEASSFTGTGQLKAQPDYMLPLFFLKSGLWEIGAELEKIYSEHLHLPMDHPLEQQLREMSVETVKMIASRLPGDRGLNTARVDSIAWQTAVNGCFPVECEGCNFEEVCDAVNGRNNRLHWDHHLTRTPNY
ncbi:MAG: queuosine salvage family protein [bacterium]